MLQSDKVQNFAGESHNRFALRCTLYKTALVSRCREEALLLGLCLVKSLHFVPRPVDEIYSDAWLILRHPPLCQWVPKKVPLQCLLTVDQTVGMVFDHYRLFVCIVCAREFVLGRAVRSATKMSFLDNQDLWPDIVFVRFAGLPPM